MKLRAAGWLLLGAAAVAAGAALMSSALAGAPASAERPLPMIAPGASAGTPPAPPSAAARAEASATPSALTGASLPDLVQNDPSLGFPLEGSSHCGPVAASDALMDLARRGWPLLAPAGPLEKERHVELAIALSTTSFMSTSPIGGTPPEGVLLGLDRWVKRAGYRVRSLYYQGWRRHPARYGLGVRTPDPAWIREGLAQGGIALVHVGWYRPQHWDNGFARRGGHWLAVARVGDGPVPAEMSLVDPAPYSGAEPRDEHATLIRLERGYLMEGAITLPARGYFMVGGGLPVKRPGDIAILDGAIVLVLERP